MLFALALTSCESSENRIADSSSVDGAIASGLTLLHVHLISPGARETQEGPVATIEFVVWQMEVLAQRVAARDVPYGSHVGFFQGLSAYNRAEARGETYAWESGTSRPMLQPGRQYLLIARGRIETPYPGLPDRFMMVPLDSSGATTEAALGQPRGTPIAVFFPPDRLTPLAADPGDAGVIADAQEQ